MEDIAAMILGSPKKAEDKTGSEGDEYETIAAEIILGVNERKPAVLAKGLKAFFALCDAGEMGEEYVTGD